MNKGLKIALWISQVLLALTFIGTALWKALTPVDQLSKMIPWTGEFPPGFVFFIAAVDLLGGVGVILPTVLKVKPKVAAFAALGCAALMASAVVFHFSRGEGAVTPFNFFMMGLSLFVAWGRWKQP
ncbi:MAG: DoxX family protein [Archangium sp.]